MGTTIRTKLSKQNKWYIPKERYLELKHWCLQYQWWKEEVSNYYWYSRTELTQINNIYPGGISPVELAYERMKEFEYKIDLFETCIKATTDDPEIQNALWLGLKEGKSYKVMHALGIIHCSERMYYDNYHKFFWILDKKHF